MHMLKLPSPMQLKILFTKINILGISSEIPFLLHMEHIVCRNQLRFLY